MLGQAGMQEQGRGLSNEHAQHLLALCLILISILLSCPGMLEFLSFLRKTQNFFCLEERRGGEKKKKEKKIRERWKKNLSV